MKCLPLVLYATLVFSRNGLNSTPEVDRERRPLAKRALDDGKQDIVHETNMPGDQKYYPISAIVALIDSLDPSAASSEIPPIIPEKLSPPNLATPVSNPTPTAALPRQDNVPDNSSPTTSSLMPSTASSVASTSPVTHSTSNVVYVTVTAQPASSTDTSESSSSEDTSDSATLTESSDSNEAEPSALDISSIFQLDSSSSEKSSASVTVPKVLVTLISASIVCLQII